MADVKLDVIITNKTNVNGYQMMFRGSGVVMNNDDGEIDHPGGGAIHYLEWSMLGEPGGWMKVEVKRKNGTLVASRDQSKIPYGAPVGYDRLKITL